MSRRRRICVHATTFQSDIQTFAHHLAAQPERYEVLLVMGDPEGYGREAIGRVRPWPGRVLDREARGTARAVRRFDPELTIVDNHLPRRARRLLVLWHGFGWRVDDLRVMRRELGRLVGRVTRPNPRFLWQAFGPWDRAYRIERSGLAPANCAALGSAYSDALWPGSARRVAVSREAVQPFYRIDLSRKTVLVALTWHHGGALAHWGADAALLEGLVRRADALGANVLIRMHDRHRYDPAHLAGLEGMAGRFANLEVKFKSEAQDALVDLQVSDVMVSNYSSILNTFYYTLRPTIHVVPAPSTRQRQLRRGRVREVRLRRGETGWKLDQDDIGGLQAASFEALLGHLERGLTDPGCCRRLAESFLARHVTGVDGRACERIQRAMDAMLEA